MLFDFEVAHCSRQCATSGREFVPGECYFSALHMEGNAAVRRDFAAEAWNGPPEGTIAWWRSRVPQADGSKPMLAPQEVLLNLFVELADHAAEAEFRYLLGLLLLRRRLVKLVETRRHLDGEVMVLDCSRRDERYELPVAPPQGAHVEELQGRLVDLLYGGE